MVTLHGIWNVEMLCGGIAFTQNNTYDREEKKSITRAMQALLVDGCLFLQC